MNQTTQKQKIFDQINVEFEMVDEKPRYRDEATQSGLIGYYYEYDAKVSYDGSELSFNYGDSIYAHDMGIEPKKYDILYSLVSDYYTPDDFEEFCNEFGYDNDSIRINKMFEELTKEKSKLDSLFPNRELEVLDMELREIEEAEN